MEASWQMSLKLDNSQEFFSEVRIKGRGGTSNNHTYVVSNQTSPLLNGARFETPSDNDGNVFTATYKTDSHTGFIDLGGINVGNQFQIEYVLAVFIEAVGGETIASGHIGDPFSTGGGFSGEVVTIPEPGTAALLMGLGVLGMATRRRVA